MKHAIKILIIFLILYCIPLFAQDIQEIYEEAKSALLDGNFDDALLKVSIANVMIDKDPNLDPNGNFRNRLLPKVEQTANNMAKIAEALDELYAMNRDSLYFPDLPVTAESITQYTRMAKNAGSSILTKRDSILSLYELDADYREGLRNTVVYQQLDQFISEGIVERLSRKFAAIASSLTDSLNSLNEQFNTVSANIEKMKKSSKTSQVERGKLEKQLEQISQERLNYMNSLSEMLIGETSPETPELQSQFIEKNVDHVFSDVIQSEIKRIQSITETDSATFKELMRNYERIKNYNQIFLKNEITSDQSALLAQYEQAIQNLKLEQPEKFNPIWAIIIVMAVIIIVLIILVMSKSKEKTDTIQPENPDRSNE